jgi:hypothetical protein
MPRGCFMTKTRRKLQEIFETNADYELTKNNKVPYVIIFEDEIYPAGRLVITISNKKYSPILLFNKGQIQITYNSNKERDEILGKIRIILKTNPGEILQIGNGKIVDQKLVYQLRVIDLELDIIRLTERSLKSPSPFGQVWRRNRQGGFEHPLQSGLESEKNKQFITRNKLFPLYCEGPFDENILCKICNPRTDFLKTNFRFHYKSDCFLYESNENQVMAESMGVGEVFAYLNRELLFLIPSIVKDVNSVSFVNYKSGKRKKESIINLLPSKSNSADGLCWQLFETRFRTHFNILDSSLSRYLPPNAAPWVYGSPSTQQRDKKKGVTKDRSGFTGYFHLDEAKRFISKLKGHYW